MTANKILYHNGCNTKRIDLLLTGIRRTDMLPEKAIKMDRSNAMTKIMTILNEDGLMIPGGRAHRIVTEYMNFKIDRMGPEEALEDVKHTKEHVVAQIQQMSL